MRHRIPQSVEIALAQREGDGSFRNIEVRGTGVDLCSNDYLGLAQNLAREGVPLAVRGGSVGATGSRLVSGTTELHESLEAELAHFHGCEAALLFGSGYEANIGVLGSIGSRHDTIVYDEYVHASMRDGIRLSHARSYSFGHNDLGDLREKIKRSRGEVFVAVESLYSMDGDLSPLGEVCALCDEYGAHVIVDEAHATGVYGPQGAGRVQELNLQNRVFARIHTFGKALGYRGAVVVGPRKLREYLINFARPFMYSTAADLFTLECVKASYRLMRGADAQRTGLQNLVGAMKGVVTEFPTVRFLQSDSPIQGVVVPSNRAVVQAEEALRRAGFFVKAIRSPTVPQGRERIRICLHAYNTLDEVRRALGVLSGEYGGVGEHSGGRG